MKRELAFALEAQSKLTGSLGRTRGSNPESHELTNNGSIDQSNGIRITLKPFNVYKRNKRFKPSSENANSLIMEDKDDFVTPTSEVKNIDVLPPVEVPSRVTRSVMKLADGECVEPELREDEAAGKAEGFESKSTIEVSRRPSTVKELFETGLLEGYPVFYNGCKKGFALRGAIKGTGILCYCSLCKGSRVVPPSTFEIHACKVYKRAAQYICLENGQSLLDVVKACKKPSMKTLATTIQTVIGPLTKKESIICQNCKGSILLTCAGIEGQLCDSCMDSVNSQSSSTYTTEVEAWSINPPEFTKSATSAELCASSPKDTKPKKRKSSEPDLAQLPRRASVRVLSREKSQQNLTTKASESPLVPQFPGIAPVSDLPQIKSQAKISKKMVSNQKSIENASIQNLSKIKRRGKISKKLSRFAPFPKTFKSASSSRWKITKKDQKMHKLVFEEGGLPNGAALAYYSRGQKLLEGYKKGSGIFCHCCNSEVSPSLFEAHAGWASRRKPYGYIYTSNGVSLHEFAISLLKDRKPSAKDSDDLCIICGDGGNLLLCDGCPRAFHKDCASLPSIPRGKWYCKFCQNKFQREKFVEYNANAVAAGRVSGVDPIEQITERCIRIVRNPDDAEVIACVLCRGYDFSRSGFGPRTVILCDQCEKEYHVGCLKKHKMADLKELPKGKWFCCLDCRVIYSTLQNLLVSGEEKLPDSLLDIIRKKNKDEGIESNTGVDVRWRLLSAKISSRETRSLLSEAVSIFHDCFDPIVDSASGRDFIPSMVYGRNIRGQDFGGMYCAILTVNSTVVSAGLLRVFGSDIAELPLVATSKGNQGKGYFQLLFSCIEKLLGILNVQSFVLPAAEEAKSIWTEKFGFVKIPPEQLSDYRKRCWQMLTFQGTSMLEKVVPQYRKLGEDEAVFDVSVESLAK